MEHFRNAKLMDGEQVVLDGLDGHLSSRVRSKTRTEWFGYFELNETQHIEPGSHYKLVLPDGRFAEIYAEDVQNSESGASHTHVAMFYVAGDLHGKVRAGLAPYRALGT